MSLDAIPPVSPIGWSEPVIDTTPIPAPTTPPVLPQGDDLPFILESPPVPLGWRPMAAPLDTPIPDNEQLSDIEDKLPAELEELEALEEADETDLSDVDEEADQVEGEGEFDEAVSDSSDASEGTVDEDGSNGGGEGSAGDEGDDSEGDSGEQESSEHTDEVEYQNDELEDAVAHRAEDAEHALAAIVAQRGRSSSSEFPAEPHPLPSQWPAEWAKDPASGLLRAAVIGAGLRVAAENVPRETPGKGIIDRVPGEAERTASVTRDRRRRDANTANQYLTDAALTDKRDGEVTKEDPDTGQKTAKQGNAPSNASNASAFSKPWTPPYV